MRREIAKHDREIEVDVNLTRVDFTVVIGKRSGTPVKVQYRSQSESDLTE